MSNEVLLDQQVFFQTYFKKALKIRAICDDYNFPAEYSPVFVNILIRGAEHFRHPSLTMEQLKQVFYSFTPEAQQELRDSRLKEDTELKSMLSKVIVGGELQRADDYLAKTEGVGNFFSKQLENMGRLYFDSDYREKMIDLYEKKVVPLMDEYDDLKVQAAFARARQSRN